MSEININILKKIAAVNNNNVHIRKNRITNRQKKRFIIFYCPKNEMFESDFSVNSLNDFIGYLTYFNNPLVVFDGKVIDICDSNSKSHIKFKKCADTIMEEVIQGNNGADSALEKTRKLITNGNFVKFELNNKEISMMRIVSKSIGPLDKVLVSFEKNDSEITIKLSGGADNTSYQSVKDVFTVNGEVSNFKHILSLEKIIPSESGSWDFYIFDDKNEVDGSKFNNVYCYMKNDDECLEIIASYTKEINE